MEQIIAIDPGRDKIGVALVSEDGTLKFSKIEKREKLNETIKKIIEKAKQDNIEIKTVALGDGTLSKEYEKLILPLAKEEKLNIELVNEYNTTAEARLRYWECNPPKGLKKILPIAWLTPPRPVDDYTAWIIGERYFKGSIK